MLAVLVTHLVHLAHLPLILAQPARIMNVDKLVKIAPIAVRVVILQPTPAVVMTPQQPNAVILAIALKLAAQIAVPRDLRATQALMRVKQNVETVVTTVPTAVLRDLHLIPVLMPAEQNVDLAAIIAQIVVQVVLLP